jgi:hypothetical protein
MAATVPQLKVWLLTDKPCLQEVTFVDYTATARLRLCLKRFIVPITIVAGSKVKKFMKT